MKRSTFIAYGVPSEVYPGAFLDHTFVVAVDEEQKIIGNWGCYGRAKEAIGTPGCREITRGSGCTLWADLLNGEEPRYVTGTRGERVDAICHSIANRLLLLAGAEICGAVGGIPAVWIYGKYGFGIDQFVDRLKTTASQVNKIEEGAIITDDVCSLVAAVQTRSASDEIRILGKDFCFHFEQLAESERTTATDIYSYFRSRREEEYKALSAAHPNPFTNFEENQAFQRAFVEGLSDDSVKCLTEFRNLFGPERYNAIFKLPPEILAKTLLGASK